MMGSSVKSLTIFICKKTLSTAFSTQLAEFVCSHSLSYRRVVLFGISSSTHAAVQTVCSSVISKFSPPPQKKKGQSVCKYLLHVFY